MSPTTNTTHGADHLLQTREGLGRAKSSCGVLAAGLVPLYRRDGTVAEYAVVDESDIALAAAHRWHLSGAGYAACRRVDGPRRLVYLHRALLGLGPGDRRYGDHINRNKLDNRRTNLRVLTSEQSAQNIGRQRGGSSRFRGVYWHSRKQCWCASIKVQGRRKHLGYFGAEELAGAAAAEARATFMPFSAEGMATTPRLDHGA